MKKPIVIGIIIVVAALALIGYFASKKITQKIGEKVIEKTIESQTGAKVDINTNSNNGDVTIKTDNGQTQYSADGGVKFPDGFPQELVIVNDAKVIMASSSETGSTITYLTDNTQDQVFQKYLIDLPVLGWKKEAEVNTGEGKMINGSKVNEAVFISIGDNNSKDTTAKTTVSIVWSEDKNR
jgi:uncharacterized protein with ATP-grasp and redox domains